MSEEINLVEKVMKDFTDRLDQDGVKYIVDDNRRIRIKYIGNNFKGGLNFVFYFDTTGQAFTISVHTIYKFAKSEHADAVEFCNKTNAACRWLKFFIDDEERIIACYDGVLPEGAAGAVCRDALRRTVRLVDDACGKLKEHLNA